MKRVLVAGWFSFEGMGASAGDLLTRDLVCEWLREIGVGFDIAHAPPFAGGVSTDAAVAADYATVVFVCGPFGNGPPLAEFIQRFRDLRWIGVNVTMLQPLEEWNPFDLLLERDSTRSVRPDLAFLARTRRVPVVGLVLIDAQPEYPTDRSEEAHAAINRLIASREMAIVRIDTRLDQNRTGLRTADEIDSTIARMDLVITTRLHGTVLALRNGVPVIAVDAVGGGAKISRQAEALQWPMAFRVEDLTDEALGLAFDFCLTDEARELAARRGVAARELLATTHREFVDALRNDAAAPD